MRSQPFIEGQRVVLRPTCHEDLPFLQELWNDGAVMRYVGFPQGLGIDEHGLQKWFEKLEHHRQTERDREHWIIENKLGQPIGEAFYKAEQDYFGYKAEKMAGIDLKLARRFWGQGYATDALRTLARHLFEERGSETLVVSPNLANQAALKLYARLGFEPKNRFLSADTKAEHQVWALGKKREGAYYDHCGH